MSEKRESADEAPTASGDGVVAGAPADREASSVAPAEDPGYPHGLKLVAILVGLCFTEYLVALDHTIISSAIPVITSRFGSVDDVGWYGSAYFLTVTALQPTFGRIYKTFSVGRDRPVHLVVL